ncbi:MAG: S24 family peptidase [bacterium]
MENYQLIKAEPVKRIMNINEIELIGDSKYFNNLNCAKMKGRMMEPTILDGSLFFYDKYDRQFVSGYIYLCRIPGADGLMVRRIFSDFHNVILKADNKKFEFLSENIFQKYLVKSIILAKVVKVLNNIE